MKRPKRQILRVTEVFHDAIGPRGIRESNAFDRLHLECGHYVDEKKSRTTRGVRRCAVCQTKKVPA